MLFLVPFLEDLTQLPKEGRKIYHPAEDAFTYKEPLPRNIVKFSPRTISKHIYE